jgi:hypothetical protein
MSRSSFTRNEGCEVAARASVLERSAGGVSFADTVFLVCGPSRDDGLPVELQPVHRGRTPSVSQKLLEALISAPTDDHHAPICCRPHEGPCDPGLPGEGSEAIPDRPLQRVAELVVTGPSFDVHQFVAVEPVEHDPVDVTTPTGAAAERNRCDRHASRFELLPH